MRDLSDAELWEDGCHSDELRNEFLAPVLAKILDEVKPRQVLDLGGATGYMSRKIQTHLAYRPKWILVDVNAERLDLARQLSPLDMQLELIQADFVNGPLEGQYECVLLTFTLLEIGDWDQITRRLSDLVGPSGHLVVALPDVWRDVLQFEGNTPGISSAFLTGRVDIPKVDKFTGVEYPFSAERLELLIGKLLRCGFSLERLQQGGADGAAFILVFRRSEQAASDGTA